VAAEPVHDIVDQIARRYGGALNFNAHPPSMMQPVGERIIRRFNDELAWYEGNAFHTLHIIVGGSSPLQDRAVEACKSLLRRYSFDRAPRPGPTWLRVSRGAAGGPASEISRNLRAVTDGLLDALSKNPNPNERLMIAVDVPPNPKVFRRLVKSRWGLRAQGDASPTQASVLEINHPEGGSYEFGTVIGYRCGLGRGRRHQRRVIVTGRSDPRRGISAIDFVLPCAMALREPEALFFGVASQEMLNCSFSSCFPDTTTDH
jgi:hypothetical protein